MGMLWSRYGDRHKKHENSEEAVDYNDLTVKELKKIADEREIKYDANIKKTDLIKLLA